MLGVDAARIGVSQGYQLVYRPDVPLSARRLNMIGSTLKFHGFLHPCNAALICLSFSVTKQWRNQVLAWFASLSGIFHLQCSKQHAGDLYLYCSQFRCKVQTDLWNACVPKRKTFCSPLTDLVFVPGLRIPKQCYISEVPDKTWKKTRLGLCQEFPKVV